MFEKPILVDEQENIFINNAKEAYGVVNVDSYVR